MFLIVLTSLKIGGSGVYQDGPPVERFIAGRTGERREGAGVLAVVMTSTSYYLLRGYTSTNPVILDLDRRRPDILFLQPL